MAVVYFCLKIKGLLDFVLEIVKANVVCTPKLLILFKILEQPSISSVFFRLASDGAT